MEKNKYLATRQHIVNVIEQLPGIGTVPLAELVVEQTKTPKPTVVALISDMAERGVFTRIRCHKRDNGYYHCYPHGKVPSDVLPEDYAPMRRGTYLTRAKRQSRLDLTEIVTPKSVETAALNPPPTPAKQLFPGVVHPAHKPGTFTIDLELPNGTKAAFTLDEARRMYEQLYRIFATVL